MFFMIRLLLIYTVLKLCFLGYVGLIDPKGDYHSPFLAEYSLIKLILDGIIYPVVFLLQLLGYETRQGYNTVGILDANGVFIEFPCLGVEIMIALVSLIWGYPGGKKKILYTFFGVLGVHIINIIRVLAIILTNHNNMNMMDISHDLYNFISYGFVLLIFYIWMQYYGKPSQPNNKVA